MTSKSIAVPPNPSALRQRRRSPKSEIKLAGTHEAVKRPGSSQAKEIAHLYRVGERLRMNNGGNIVARSASTCQVLFLLPYEGYGSPLYRVRSEIEQFERIVSEVDLSRGLSGA